MYEKEKETILKMGGSQEEMQLITKGSKHSLKCIKIIP
jgi:hypothetical protein